jgi:hypothetical protein
MRPTRTTIKAVAVLAVMAALAACGGKTTVKSNMYIKGAPDWVNKGTTVLKDQHGRLFHGVGLASDMGNLSLQTTTSEDRARAEVARILTSYMDVVSKDYVSANRNDGRNVSEEQVSREIKNLTQTNLAGVKIIGHWRDRKTNNLFSLAELDVRQIKQTLDTYRQMNEGLRSYIDKNADRVFDGQVEKKP